MPGWQFLEGAPHQGHVLGWVMGSSGSGTSSSSDLGQSAFTRSHRETGAAGGLKGAFLFFLGGKVGLKYKPQK